MRIVATNHNGRTAQMSAMVDIMDRAEKPAGRDDAPCDAARASRACTPESRLHRMASLARVARGPASGRRLGSNRPIHRCRSPRSKARRSARTSTSDLPPFSAGANTAGLTLRADAPPGLGLCGSRIWIQPDLGEARPRRDRYSFDVVATDASGQSAKMAVKLLVAPSAAAADGRKIRAACAVSRRLRSKSRNAPLNSPVQPLTPIEKAKAFVAAFDGGDCFLVKPRATAGPHSYQVFGREPEPFPALRFDLQETEVGVEADLRAALITAEECPALDLIRLGTASGAAPPRVELANYSVGRGKPLGGNASRTSPGAALTLSSSITTASPLDLTSRCCLAGTAQRSNVPLTPDRGSVGPDAGSPRGRLAEANPCPGDFASGSLGFDFGPTDGRGACRASASVEADYFKLAN